MELIQGYSLHDVIERIDPLNLRNQLNRHVGEFDEEVGNLVLNGLNDAMVGSARSTESETAVAEDDFQFASERQKFAHNIYFIGLLTLLDIRFEKIAMDIYLLGHSVPDCSDHTSRAAEIDEAHVRLKSILAPSSTERAARLDLKNVSVLLNSEKQRTEDYFERLRVAKVARNLIVHPQGLEYRFEAGGTFVGEFAKGHDMVRRVFPDAIDQHGRIQIEHSHITQVAEDARTVVGEIVNNFEFDYLVLLHDDLSEHDKAFRQRFGQLLED